ncbi:hypothetical protein Glove_87g124 [Diversispora epigaea]|uniref:Uncharacterized protein n=1 Tax=Diversispora epigaea TaxID=1348612 RepID=A0A397JD06_9GLOM|nr:hypothetical protein Glove_87g124 [Diversispora epigaea]
MSLIPCQTIVTTKVKGTDEIIDGFNPLAFVGNSILSRVKNDYYTLWYPYNKDKYDPIFEHYNFLMGSKVSNFTQDKLNRCF